MDEYASRRKALRTPRQALTIPNREAVRNGWLVFAPTAIAGFAATIAAATANGWTWTQATLPSANFVLWATTTAGPNFRPGSGLLFDI